MGDEGRGTGATPADDPRRAFEAEVERRVVERTAAIEADRRRLVVLAEASRAFAASAGDPRLLDQVARTLAESTGDACTVRLLSEDGRWLQAVAAYHPDPELLQAIRQVVAETAQRSDAGVWRPVIEEHRTIRLPVADQAPPADASPAQAAFIRRHRVRWIMGAPLLVGGRTLGGLSLVRYDDATPFTDDDERLIRDLADRAALAIAASQAHAAERAAREAAERSAERSAALLAVAADLAESAEPAGVADAVLGHGASILGAQAGYLYRLDDSGSALEHVRTFGYPAETIARWRRIPLDANLPAATTARTGEPLWYDSPDQFLADFPHLAGTSAARQASAWVTLPLVTDRRSVGVLGFSFAEPRSFDAEDRAFLLTLAAVSAQALERARLFEAERAARARTEAEQARLQAILDAIPVGVFVADADGRLVQVNGEAERIWGGSVPFVSDIVGYAAYRGRWAASGEALRSDEWAMARALRHGETVRSQLVDIERFDGGHGTVLNNGAPIRDSRGRIVGAVVASLDVTALRRAEAERARALEVAREAIRLRDEVLTTVGHDLKNPLTTLLATAQLLRRDVRPVAESPEAARLDRGLARIVGACERMAAMIQEIVNAARLEIGRSPTAQAEPTDLVALARQVVADQQHGTERHRLRVASDVPELVGRWDEARLRRVLDNLVGNAIKYSPDGGEVTVTIARVGAAVATPSPGPARADQGPAEADAPESRPPAIRRPEGDWAVITVSDQGIGIPAADLPHLFERFRRAGNVGEIPGSGVGLSSIRRTVEEHGGTIAVESREGRGTTVTVRLPLVPPVPVDAQRADDGPTGLAV